HVLIGRARHEPGPCVEGEGVQVHGAGYEAERLALRLRNGDNELQQPPRHAHPEVVGMHVHDAERDVRFARMIEAGACQPPGALIFRDDAAAGIERLIDRAEQFRVGGIARKDRGLAVGPVPGVGRDVDQFGHFRPVVACHGPQGESGHGRLRYLPLPESGRCGLTMMPSKMAASVLTWQSLPTTQRSRCVPRMTTAPSQRMLSCTDAPSSTAQLSPMTVFSRTFAPARIFTLLPMATG